MVRGSLDTFRFAVISKHTQKKPYHSTWNSFQAMPKQTKTHAEREMNKNTKDSPILETK